MNGKSNILKFHLSKKIPNNLSGDNKSEPLINSIDYLILFIHKHLADVDTVLIYHVNVSKI